ncbi:MAG: sugar ABC transporter permease [Lachnospiraceae bacterium]|nr:sugar ABC transporter permease [Lachnospiraceae bacterium]
MKTEAYRGQKKKKSFFWHMKKNWQLYVLLAPTIIYLLLFNYLPIVGVQIAFRDYTAIGGIWNSKWVGLKHFAKFFSSIQFGTLLGNTIKISVYSLLWGFPMPIILAIMLNECGSARLKKGVQMLTYAPHFISTVVLVSMLNLFLDVDTGIINKIIELFGGTASNLIGNEKAFRTIYIASGIWQGCGWSSIIYIAALAGVDSQLYEAAKIDGANRLQKVWYIDLPSILPTILTLFILDCGNILNVGYEKVYLMQNTLNQSVSEVISTYVYKLGLLGGQFSYTTAIGLFNSVVNIIVLAMVNQISKKVNEVSLF